MRTGFQLLVSRPAQSGSASWPCVWTMSGMRSDRMAIRLISSDRPCSVEQDEAGRDQGPDRPADQAVGVARRLAAGEFVRHDRPGVPDGDDAEGQQEEQGAEDLDPDLGAARPAAVEDVDLDMLALQQRVARGQQEDGGEQVPLQLQPGVGAEREGFPQDGVAGADQDRDQDEPGHGPSDPAIDSVDDAAGTQQSPHLTSPVLGRFSAVDWIDAIGLEFAAAKYQLLRARPTGDWRRTPLGWCRCRSLLRRGNGRGLTRPGRASSSRCR